jgi:glycosyltransferase involved in cell wall biosynthesis
MNLCFLCCEYPPSRHGGIGSFVRLLGRALVRRGHRVRVAGTYPTHESATADPGDHRDQKHRYPDHAYQNHEYQKHGYQNDHGVEVWRLPAQARQLGWAAARFELFRLVSQWAKRGEIDLIEVPDYGGLAAAWPKLPVPLVARLHGSSTYFAHEMGWPVDSKMRWLEGWSLARADFRCSTSRYTADRSAEVFHAGWEVDAVLHNAVEQISAASTTPRHPRRILFTGTLTPKKGIVSLIEAWPEVQAAFPDAELHLVGGDGRVADGLPASAMLRNKLGSFLGHTVHYHGYLPRERVLALLASARLAVFPSFSEAFALAPMEAMAHGCATVYTRLASGPELIEDGRTGLLVDPREPHQIAAALIRLLADPPLADRLAHSGREHVCRHFSLEAMSRKNEEFYLACLGRFQALAA